MKVSKHPALRFAICIDNSEYSASLELHKVYRMLPDKEADMDGDLWIIDESGEDYLYPADYFVVLDISKETAQILSKAFVNNV